MNAKLISEGGVAAGTRVVLEGGGELQGVTRVTFTAEAGDLCRLEAEIMMAAVEAEGLLSVHAVHPETGALGEVARVVFADGSEWSST